MTTINFLSTAAPLSPADQVPVYSSANGDARKTSLTALAALLQTLIAPGDDRATQYASPNATAFNVQIAPPLDGGSVWLLLTPTGAFAAGTITLPAQALCADRQELLVSCTQAVTTLTVAGNGSTVNGAPTTLAANAFFRLRFDGVNRAWYRVG
jgi:hypothetical protein